MAVTKAVPWHATEAAEDGVALSAATSATSATTGTRQRVALARSLIRAPPPGSWVIPHPPWASLHSQPVPWRDGQGSDAEADRVLVAPGADHSVCGGVLPCAKAEV